MATENVAPVAAATAAISSLVSLLTTIYFGRLGVREAQYRELLKPFVVDLGDQIHQIVACSKLASDRIGTGQNPEKYFAQSEAAAKRLVELHRKVKYSLPGVSEGLRTLVRLSTWVHHLKSEQQVFRRNQMVEAADLLREELDAAIRTCYIAGRPPDTSAIKRVKEASAQFRKIWSQGPDSRKAHSDAEEYYPEMLELGSDSD